MLKRAGSRGWWGLGLAVLVGAVGAVALSPYLPAGIDWDETYRPAGQAVAQGISPYSVVGFRYAPWAVLPVVPLALLPARVGRALFLLMSLLAFAYVPVRLGARPMALGAFLLSPPVVHCLLNANIDWMPLLGFVLPPPVGLFLVVIKPQVGIGVALYWLVEAARRGGWRQVVRTFAPVSLALLASLLVFGFWPAGFAAPVGFWWNASLWPLSIPVGLALMVAAWRRRKMEYAMAASPCLSPYALLHSWSGALVALSRAEAEMVAAVVGLWVVVALRLFGGA